MNTRKLIAAAIAVFIALVPVSVEARHTEDTFYNKYSEGEILGSMTYSDVTLPVLYGLEQSTVDTGNVELFGLSAPDHLIMLSHSDKGFSKLFDNSQNGTKINVVLDDCSVWYEVYNSYWIDQATWQNEEFMYDFYYNDNTPLTLVTCNHRNGVRGRWVVQCTYSCEPVVQEISESVVTYEEIGINENTETYVQEVTEQEIEVTEQNEAVEEIQKSDILPLYLLKMKRPYATVWTNYRGQ